MLRFEPWEGSLDEWGEILRTYPDRQIFQTPAWMRFIAESQGGAKPVIAALKDGNSTVGHFAGLEVRRAGFRILGSPFVGWTTPYMGVRLVPGVEKRAALAALIHFAFDQSRFAHLEVMDRQLSLCDGERVFQEHSEIKGWEVDLTPTEEEILARMYNDRRRCIRKSKRDGVVIEECWDESFVEDYYPQLEDVFAKQSLVPTYSRERIRLLIRHLLPTGMLLLLRARDRSGRCIATGIFPALNDRVYFFGGASWRDGQILHPNEPIQWYAMRYWKQRGITAYDMCGGGEYKKQYGGREISVLWFRSSKYRWVSQLRMAAAAAFRLRQKWLGWWRGRGEKHGAARDE